MEEFTESFGFIVIFIILLLLISMTVGDKVLFPFLMLVLAGMMVTNWGKINQTIRRYSL